jgi:tRNA(fMet)-specific endonuclease VapC
VILDTNALSAYADGVPAVVQQIGTADELHLPVIVLGEYRFGIATSRRQREYEAWLARGRAFWNLLPVVEETTAYYAKIRQQLKARGALASERCLDRCSGTTAPAAGSEPRRAL